MHCVVRAKYNEVNQTVYCAKCDNEGQLNLGRDDRFNADVTTLTKSRKITSVS